MKLTRTQSKWFILLLTVVCIITMYITNNHHTITSGYNTMIDEPWRKDINLYNSDFLQHYYNTILGLYNEYPWQLQLSYLVIVFSLISMIILLYIMAWDVYDRKNKEKIYKVLKEKYYDRIKEAFVNNDSDNNTILKLTEEIKGENLKTYENIALLKLLVEIRMETGISKNTIKNMQNVIYNIGLHSFIEENLLKGSIRNKIDIIQNIRILHIEISDSTMSRLINEKNIELRKASRLYYILSNKEDPFKYFEDYNTDKLMSTWDMLENHQILKEFKELDRSIPPFIPLINKIQDKSITEFFIKETGYYGTDKEIEYLKKFLETEREESLVIAAIDSITKRKDSNAVLIMKERFYLHTENVKRKILMSVGKIDGENSLEFFENAYKNTSSRLTKRIALECLWKAEKTGKEIFYKLKEQASIDDKILFRHVEDPIINPM